MPRPGWPLTIVALLGLAVTLLASYWQYNKAVSKVALQTQYAQRQAAPPIELKEPLPTAEDIAYRKVRANGVFVPEKAIYIDNRIRDGAAGYEVIVPLRIAGSERYVLVNRGWVARGRTRSELPAFTTPEGAAAVLGNAMIPSERTLELSDATIEGRIWQNLLLNRYRRLQQIDIVDFVIEEESDRPDGFNRNWAAPGFGIETNKSYALQWMLFAALIVFFYSYYGFVRNINETSK